MTGPTRWWKAGLAGPIVLAVAAAAWFWPRPGPVENKALPTEPGPAPLSRVLLPQAVAVAPGVYLLGKTSPGAAYAVETSDGLVLIDSGLEDSAATVLDQLARLHLDVGRLRAILLTHVHADHSLGAESLRTRTGAKVHAGRADCLPLRTGEPREAFCSTFAMSAVTPHATTVDVELAGDETLAFGDTRFGVIAAPGHTPGSMCYVLERPDLRALFTGDVVLHLNPATEDTLGTYTAYLPPLYRGNVRDYLTTLRRLRALPLPDLVLPGHPQMDLLPQSPRVSAARWQALLDQGIAEMARLLARYEADGANFLDGIPRELLPGLHYLGNFGGSAVYCLNAPKGRFVVDAPGSPLLDAFLANRFQKLGWGEARLTAVLLTSAGAEATAGLDALVHGTGCQVVVPDGAVEAARRLCPAGTELHSAQDLEKSGWLEVRALPVPGRGPAAVAYQVRWAGKTVLFSGRVPVKLTPPGGEQLVREVAGPGGSAEQYLKSLDRLARVKPDLWLPAVPVHGQNANLYDDDWAKVLRQNRQVFPLESLPLPAGGSAPATRGTSPPDHGVE
jgi:glyoxylase-like metal-dependent hydrolase (beta-lactamase superfamily II)